MNKKFFDEKKQKMKKMGAKVAGLATTLTVGSTSLAYAAPNIGQSAQTWMSDQLFYAAIIVVGFLLVKELIKKNTVKAVVTLVVGGVVCVLIKKPTIIENVGTWILQILGIS